jgi:hypothetical protein
MVPGQEVHDRLVHDQMMSRERPGGIMGYCIRDISNKINAILRVMNNCGNCTISRASFASLLRRKVSAVVQAQCNPYWSSWSSSMLKVHFRAHVLKPKLVNECCLPTCLNTTPSLYVASSGFYWPLLEMGSENIAAVFCPATKYGPHKHLPLEGIFSGQLQQFGRLEIIHTKTAIQYV